MSTPLQVKSKLACAAVRAGTTGQMEPLSQVPSTKVSCRVLANWCVHPQLEGVSTATRGTGMLTSERLYCKYFQVCVYCTIARTPCRSRSGSYACCFEPAGWCGS